MLIGAHVSPAGGPANAVTRGEERACRSIQIFNQSPRAWRPREYSEEEVAAFHEAMAASEDVEALLIHAVYLLNCASEDKEIRDKSRAALISALDAGHKLKAAGVVLHPGSAKAGDVPKALKRAGQVINEALDESTGRCHLHLEDTAGAGGTLGRSFEELAALLEAAGGGKRLGICLDSCHLHASDSASTSRTASPMRSIDSSSGSPTVEPGWKTTPSAPIASPTRSAWVSEAIDFLRISGSFVAALIR